MSIDNKLLKKYNKKGPRYTSYPPATHFSEKYDDKDFINSVINSNKEDPQNVSVYIHIPFCPQICHFCGCTTESPGVVLCYHTSVCGCTFLARQYLEPDVSVQPEMNSHVL